MAKYTPLMNLFLCQPILNFQNHNHCLPLHHIHLLLHLETFIFPALHFYLNLRLQAIILKFFPLLYYYNQFLLYCGRLVELGQILLSQKSNVISGKFILYKVNSNNFTIKQMLTYFIVCIVYLCTMQKTVSSL